MPDNEVERLTVTLEANYADFLKQIDKAVQEAAAKLKEVDDAPKKSKTTFEELGGYLSGKFLSIRYYYTTNPARTIDGFT